MTSMHIQTERLEMRVLDTSATDMVLEFYNENKEDFEHWDPPHSGNFYDRDYQKEVLIAERELMLEGRGVRFYVFEQSDPETIVGSVSFAYLNQEDGHSCILGYKLGTRFRHKGYAYEATSALIPFVAETYGVRKLEADILPENLASRRLALRLGFEKDEIPILLETCSSGKRIPHDRFFLKL